MKRKNKMDLETGERKRDCETGELIIPMKENYNSETGEPEQRLLSGNCNGNNTKPRNIFKISFNNNPTAAATNDGYVSCDYSRAILFLLPTLFFYPRVMLTVIAVLETIIHTWAHHINKKLADKNVYYQSPLHIIVSEFCAKCRETKSMDQIKRIQDKRTNRFKCNYEYYVRRMVT